jgi:hypothetical protein
MAWYRFPSDLDESPEFEALSGEAVRLLIRCFGYCARHLTDGAISEKTMARLGRKRAVEELVLGAFLVRIGRGFVVTLAPRLLDKKDDILAKREHAAARMSAYRKNPHVAESSSVTGVRAQEVFGLEKEIEKKISESSASEIRSEIPASDSRRRSAATSATSDPRVRAIYDFWVSSYEKVVGGRGSARLFLTQKRAQKVLSRLKDGYTAEDIQNAVRGHLTSEYHREHGYLDLELTCRDPQHLDMFLARHDKNLAVLGKERVSQVQVAERENESAPIPGNLFSLAVVQGGKS